MTLKQTAHIGIMRLLEKANGNTVMREHLFPGQQAIIMMSGHHLRCGRGGRNGRDCAMKARGMNTFIMN